MVKPKGMVYGVEHIPELVAQSQANVQADCKSLLGTNLVCAHTPHHSSSRFASFVRCICISATDWCCARDASQDIRVSDGFMGLPSAAPFDAIHVGAAAETVPQALKTQLKVGGRLVIPVRAALCALLCRVSAHSPLSFSLQVGPAGGDQQLQVIERTSETAWSTSVVCGVMYVPLTDKSKQLATAAAANTSNSASAASAGKKP